MPLIATRGAASAQGFGEFAQTTAPVYIEDVFSTYLYTGTGTTQTITNGIDLSTNGGLTWFKLRGTAENHVLIDSARGIGQKLYSNSTAAQATATNFISSYNTTGFTIGNTANPEINSSNANYNYVSWTFREQPKFFDIVTYTGNGVAGRTVSHNLGSTPGCIIVKKTSGADAWAVYHRSEPSKYGYLNQTAAFSSSFPENVFGNGTSVVAPTSTQFTVGPNSEVNGNGATYVAYLFAHNAGGFGLTGSDNVISCGSFTTDGSGNSPVVNLGYEPQWLLVKQSGASGSWYIIDTMRAWNNAPSGSTSALTLYPNLTNAEAGAAYWNPTSTGFYLGSVGNANTAFIYIAIRRGPMKTPTTGTSVFSPQAWTGNGTAGRTVTCGFSPDLFMGHLRGSANNNTIVLDKLRGFPTSATDSSYYLLGNATDAEANTTEYIYRNNMDGIGFGTTASGNNQFNGNTFTTVGWFFQRAPGFFDEVCYTGTGSNTTISHNLGVAPELIIIKRRSSVNNWLVYNAISGNQAYLLLNDTGAVTTGASTVWNSTSPTSSVFSLGTNATGNASGETYVAYLFATVAGVSKVGSYTGTGALQTVNCGFTGGARFVLIKRTDSTGDWWVYDSARGISSSNDPYLFLNSTAAEVTNTNYVDTTSVGFQVTAAAPAGLNANGGTYIFLAIA